jgi:nicotinic acid mononucleotide adenylyltransferase
VFFKFSVVVGVDYISYSYAIYKVFEGPYVEEGFCFVSPNNNVEEFHSWLYSICCIYKMNVRKSTLQGVVENLKELSARRVGWFGFSADPPTLAHECIVRSVLDQNIVDVVVVFVSGRQVGKSYVASDEDRVRMSELGFGRLMDGSDFCDRIILSDFDINGMGAWRWWDLWEFLNHDSLDSRISMIGDSSDRLNGTDTDRDVEHWLVVGGDQWELMESTWYRGMELKKKGRFVVVPRELSELGFQSSDRVKVLSVQPLSGSSSMVREGRLDLVSIVVRQYILYWKLYGFGIENDQLSNDQ